MPNTLTGGVTLDSFPGATDDAKLTAALAHLAAQTYKPPLLFGDRDHTFSQGGRQWFSGLALQGSGGDQRTSHQETPNRLRYTGSGAWWKASGAQVRRPGLRGLYLEGNAGAQFFDAGSTVIWKAQFLDLGFGEWKHVLGRPGTKWLNTACTFRGYWNVNNCRDTAFTLGGSDSNLWTDGMLLDSPPSLSGGFDGRPLLHLDYQSKTNVSRLYVTGDGIQAVRISGSDNTHGLVLSQCRLEGRNDGSPSDGAVLRIDGGWNTLRDCWTAYATPGAPASRSGERGVIQVNGGNTLVSGGMYGRARGASEATPWIDVAGRGVVRIDGAAAVTSGRPLVKRSGGQAYCSDGSVTIT